MGREFARTERVAGAIRRELSRLILEELNDPRANGVTVTEVRVSRDLAHARIWFSVLDPAADKSAVTDALQGAAGFLRRELGRGMRLRVVPELKFEPDLSIEQGARLIDTIDEAVRRDVADAAGDDDND